MTEETLFIEALEIRDPAERAAFLDRACGDDTALRARLGRLLDRHGEAGSFLDRPAALPPTEAPAPPGGVPTEALPAARPDGGAIGPYKLVEVIGEGGMGTVWLAQQTEPVRRLVALKVIKAGMDTRQVVARFEAERQALALMDHPNIAKVLDGGVTGEGRPYFVMELVKGVPITRFCDERCLDPRQRLELFVPVCQAVQHAHQKGVIHRDLKPSNVLVALYDGRPVPKVIDFGVAKAAGGPLTEKTLVTGLGAVLGTPEYMSPEQAELNQLDVDTRSDIYSLGAILYELLTGTTPLQRKRVREAALLEVLRLVREEEPPRPSTRLSTTKELPSIAASRGVEPRKLPGLLRGELDWIVMKALEKDRDRRYQTANGFALDVQRYLAGEAVQAVPPSAGYRARKFARRNKGGLAVAALVLSFLVLAGSGLGWAVRDRGARQAKAAGQVELILAEVDRLEREQRWGEALAAARRAEAVVIGGEADAATARRVGGPLKDLQFIDRLDQVRMQRATWVEGKFDNAGADREYARAFRDRGVDVDGLAAEAAIDRLKARPALSIPLGAALDDWADARRGVSVTDASGWMRLIAVARGIDPEPLRDRLRSTWVRPDSEVRDDLRRLADSIDVRAHHPATIVSLARTLRRVEHPDAAVRVLRDAQYAYPGDFFITYELAGSLQAQKDYEGAVRFGTAAVAIRPNAVVAFYSLGFPLREQGKPDEAVAAFRKAIELDPKSASAYSNLGATLAGQNKPDEAIAAFRKNIEFDPKSYHAHYALGLALSGRKKFDEAIAAYRRAIELDPKFAAVYYRNLGTILCHHKQDHDGAVAAFEEALRLQPDNAEGHFRLASALALSKRWDRSAGVYADALQRFGAQLWPGPSYEAIRWDEVFSRLTALRPDDHLPWIMRARLHSLERDWKRAAADYLRANESPTRTDQVPLIREDDDLTAQAFLLLLLGDRPGYERFCKTWADRIGRAQGWDYSLARAWAGSPRPVVPARQIVERARKPVQADRNPWSLHVLSLAHFRGGEFELAIEHAEESNAGYWSGTAKALNWLVLAMGHHRLGHTAQARTSLERARILAGQPSPLQPPGLEWPDMAPTDVLEFDLLRREAEELIDPKSTQNPDKDKR